MPKYFFKSKYKRLVLASFLVMSIGLVGFMIVAIHYGENPYHELRMIASNMSCMVGKKKPIEVIDYYPKGELLSSNNSIAWVKLSEKTMDYFTASGQIYTLDVIYQSGAPLPPTESGMDLENNVLYIAAINSSSQYEEQPEPVNFFKDYAITQISQPNSQTQATNSTGQFAIGEQVEVSVNQPCFEKFSFTFKVID